MGSNELLVEKNPEFIASAGNGVVSVSVPSRWGGGVRLWQSVFSPGQQPEERKMQRAKMCTSSASLSACKSLANRRCSDRVDGRELGIKWCPNQTAVCDRAADPKAAQSNRAKASPHELSRWGTCARLSWDEPSLLLCVNRSGRSKAPGPQRGRSYPRAAEVTTTRGESHPVWEAASGDAWAKNIPALKLNNQTMSCWRCRHNNHGRYRGIDPVRRGRCVRQWPTI